MKYSSEVLFKHFENAYSEFHNHFTREEDPVLFAHTFTEHSDQEIVAFLSAIFAYGNRKQIIKSLQGLFRQLGPKPYKKIARFSFEDAHLKFKHRFSTASDLQIILSCLKIFLKKYDSIQNYFESHSKTKPVKEILSAFQKDFFETQLFSLYPERKRYLEFLVSTPEKGSCCKRLNLFLRWVARPKDNIDLGLWKNFGTERLMLPVDTHLFKIIKHLKWSKRKSPSWKTVEEATARLRQINVSDPIRYDFSLCHLAMRGNLQAFIASLKQR